MCERDDKFYNDVCDVITIISTVVEASDDPGVIELLKDALGVVRDISHAYYTLSYENSMLKLRGKES